METRSTEAFDESVTLLEEVASALADGRFTPVELAVVAVALARVIRSVLVIFKHPVPTQPVKPAEYDTTSREVVHP